MSEIQSLAYPRVGLLGNPSDLYDGHVLGFTFVNFQVTARLVPAQRTQLIGPGGTQLDVESLAGLDARASGGGVGLMAAALRRLAAEAPVAVDPVARPFRLHVDSDIPRQAGLSGSSAIVVACLRAMAEHFGVALSDFECSERALEAETVELAMVAGPQDRVLQSYNGFLSMDFSGTRAHGRYERLEPGLLPPLLVAHHASFGEASGDVHASVHARWVEGDAEVHRGVAKFPELARRGLAALRAKDLNAFADCIDQNLEARQALWPVPEADLELAARARKAGAAAKLCGSGGALVIVPRPGVQLKSLASDLSHDGWALFEPELPG
ncbi:MAG: glucuronokinase [Planctomycetota bacterium]|jgi:glucuronokinase